jgi:hypothetical protein
MIITIIKQQEKSCGPGINGTYARISGVNGSDSITAARAKRSKSPAGKGEGAAYGSI